MSHVDRRCPVAHPGSFRGYDGRPAFLRLTCSPETPTNTASQCAPVRTAVPWESHTFDIARSSFFSIAARWGGFDGFLLLYSGSFDPSSPRSGLLATNDDLNRDPTQSEIQIELRPGTYTVVVSGFSARDAGRYSGTITGTESLIRVVTEASAQARYTGQTTEGTFQRPSCPSSNAPSGCSLAGGSYRYSSRLLLTGQTGPHQVRSVQKDRDGVLLLYAGAFDPARPLEHLVGYDDDDYSSTSSAIDGVLSATEPSPTGGGSLGYYVLVTTSKASSSVLLSFENEFRPVQRSDADLGETISLETVSVESGTLGASSPTMPLVSCRDTYPADPVRSCTTGSRRPYQASTFTVVPSTGFSVSSAQQFDGNLLLYLGSFNPADPLRNLVAQNNDGSGGRGTSDLLQFNLGRTALQFVLVTQGTTAGATGSYVNQGSAAGGSFSFMPYMPVAAEESPGADRLVLASPAPNPTAGSTTLRLEVPDGRPVTLRVYDALGRVVADLADGPLSTGPHTWTLDTSRFAPGVYVVRAQTVAGGASKRLIVR